MAKTTDLSRRLRRLVPERIRRRGADYWRNGAVEVEFGDAFLVETAVQGNEAYGVVVAVDSQRRRLEVSCTCPYFADRLEACKHIWASLLAADAAKCLTEAHRLPELRLAATPPEQWEGLAGADGELDEEELEELAALATADAGWTASPAGGPAATRRDAEWRRQLLAVGHSEPLFDPTHRAWLGERQILYVIDPEASRRDQAVVVELRCRDRKRDGDWGALKSQTPPLSIVDRLPDQRDRQLLAMVAGARQGSPVGWGYDPWTRGRVPGRFVPPAGVLPSWIRLATDSGRLLMPVPDGGPPAAVTWDPGEPWSLEIEVSRDPQAAVFKLEGGLAREGGERLPLAEPILLSAAGLVFFDGRVARLDHGEAFGWISLLRRAGPVEVPVGKAAELVELLVELPRPPVLRLPAELRYEEVAGTPVPALRISRAQQTWPARRKLLELELSFDYDGEPVAWEDPRSGVFDGERGRLLKRDRRAEKRARQRLGELKVREEAAAHDRGGRRLVMLERRLPAVARTLTAEGWRIEAEGRLYRPGSGVDLRVSSGIDWFELHGRADFGGATVAFPKLLRALRKGQPTVVLDDGSLGIVPEDWIERYGSLGGLGKVSGDHLRFQTSQIGLLDALLAAEPETDADQAVEQARARLARFDGIEPRPAPPGFRGELRGYQRDGLGWMDFLADFGFGGCLADDMGLGKTVQVLALLEERRRRRRESEAAAAPLAPSLVVVPKSLVFNWLREAERFTPQLRILEHAGPQRRRETGHFADYDVVLTTYGTLRRDVPFLKELTFDYAILDEAQAIKNKQSATAKASRLIAARHRLALTGTPIENHLGELMSLFEFLNPGLFGPGRQLAVPRTVLEGGAAGANGSHPAVKLIAGAVRPFVLRRTKEQVAPELPPKLEQTLYCELAPRQRREYDQLRRHYRESLLTRVEEDGLARSKIQVLEALLRLRQAACHPGLIDRRRVRESSAKLDLLLPQLEEVIEEGHKVLVFSQFTSMLAIVRKRLEARDLVYEYLDGKTRNREERVDRFQNDPDCRIFLISLKAGGVGLNLTAAGYVFLLDPWWNPAVEVQAIDRTHRIGQTRQVFAYRLIARDTVEEKVLELQRSKRELADAIIRADRSLIRNLTREDLALLLS